MWNPILRIHVCKLMWSMVRMKSTLILAYKESGVYHTKRFNVHNMMHWIVNQCIISFVCHLATSSSSPICITPNYLAWDILVVKILLNMKLNQSNVTSLDVIWHHHCHQYASHHATYHNHTFIDVRIVSSQATFMSYYTAIQCNTYI